MLQSMLSSNFNDTLQLQNITIIAFCNWRGNVARNVAIDVISIEF